MKPSKFPPHLRMALPTIPFDSPDFKPTRGADVQATWRRFGWTPIAKDQPAPIVAPPMDEQATFTVRAFRRSK